MQKYLNHNLDHNQIIIAEKSRQRLVARVRLEKSCKQKSEKK